MEGGDARRDPVDLRGQRGFGLGLRLQLVGGAIPHRQQDPHLVLHQAPESRLHAADPLPCLGILKEAQAKCVTQLACDPQALVLVPLGLHELGGDPLGGALRVAPRD